MGQPATWSHAIRFVIEFLWPQRVKVREQTFFEQIGVQLGDTVD